MGSHGGSVQTDGNTRKHQGANTQSRANTAKLLQGSKDKLIPCRIKKQCPIHQALPCLLTILSPSNQGQASTKGNTVKGVLLFTTTKEDMA